MLGLLGMLVGASMVFSLPWAFPICGQTPEFEERGFWGLVFAILASLTVSGTLYVIGRRTDATILRKEALAVVGLGWIFAGILGSLPFLFSGTEHELYAGTENAKIVRLSIADCLFESVSGFTTTGASVLTELEDPRVKNPETTDRKLIPRCILFWRSFTHWLGGMGIIVLFVAVLGQLGAGGKALMRREVPGPITETVRPRVRETAIVMWAIYMGISVLLTVLLYFEGMNFYDALCHCFGTMATGGFSTYNASVGEWKDHPWIEVTIILFMLVAGTNFSLYYLCLRSKSHEQEGSLLKRFSPLYRDPEFRAYLVILLSSTFLLTFSLMKNHVYPTLAESIRHASFMSVAIMTTTGFGTEDFTKWSEFSKGLLLLLMFIGGCAGSTGGGMKVVRFLFFAKIIRLEIEQAFRPNVVRPLKIFGVSVDKSLRHEVVVYFSLILLIFISSWMTLAAIEPDTQWIKSAGETAEQLQDDKAEKLLDCASAVASCLNNIGPGLGVLGPHSNYSGFSSQGKLLLTALMLLGRLELFAILVLLFPSFWRDQ